MRRRLAFLVLLVGVPGLGVGTYLMLSAGPGDPWIEVGTTDEIEHAGVTYIAEANAFIVPDDAEPVALAAWSTHMGPSEPVLFCRSAGAFFSPAHGEKWDRRGLYADGPAPRGLDRLSLQVLGDTVYVDPTTVLMGPARGSEPHEEIHPPFCDEGYRTVAPGIVESARY